MTDTRERRITYDECFLRQQRSRDKREEYLLEIAALPSSVQTYSHYCHREEASTVEATSWLRRQLEGLDGGQA